MSGNNPRDALAQLTFGHIPARAIQVAAEMGIADLIAGGKDTDSALAGALGADETTFHRYMRYLVSLDLFDAADGQYSLKPMGDLLRSDAEGTQRPAARLLYHLFPALVELEHAVRTGEPGYDKFFGKPLFDDIGAKPELAPVFDDAMSAIHGPETGAMLDAYDMAGIGTVMDVGGGNGSLLIATLQRFPDMQGILFDLPHVLERAASNIEVAGLSGRCITTTGNFFEAVPGTADAIVLRHIIHDWPDDKSIEILKNCGSALTPGGRVLVVETVIPEGNEPSTAKLFDLSMMVYLAGAERTEAAYSTLFEAAGLRLEGVTPTGSPVSVVEARVA